MEKRNGGKVETFAADGSIEHKVTF